MIDFILNLDKHLEIIVRDYGAWTYLILATVVFLESAFVIFPFLPGDSWLFAAGVAASRYGMNIYLIIASLIVAGVVGNDINYKIGRKYGKRLFSRPNHRFFNHRNLDKTNAFFAKHGAKAVVMCRFVPFVRSFVPFVAGMADMDYRRFTRFNIIGAIAWVVSFTLIGYLFSKVFEKYFHVAILAIIVVTLVPMVVEIWRHRRAAKREAAEAAAATQEDLLTAAEVVND